MATSVAIAGTSGTGKSTSMGNIPELKIKGLDPKETYIINVSGKDLPFKGWKKLYNSENKNYIESSDPKVIVDVIIGVSSTRKEIKNIVLDDAQYLMAFEFMRRAKESGYGKFADIGVNLGKVLEAVRNARKDIKTYFLWHPETSGDSFKLKTVGKMVDDYLTLEGLFTVILYTKVEKGSDNKIKYSFITNNDGIHPAKSPVGMFKDIELQNDLGLVSELIDKYNEGE